MYLDQWFERDVKPRLAMANASLIRFADDFIVGLELESDAREIPSGVAQTSGTVSRYQIAEDKTKLIRFGRFARRDCQRRRRRGTRKRSTSSDSLTTAGMSRAGRFKLKRKTSTKKLRAQATGL